MIEKNGIGARNGKKSHIGDEDLVGIPKFYNKEHDFYSYNLFDFHKFGLNIKSGSLLTLRQALKVKSNIPYGWISPNLYDDEIIEGVKCVNDLISINSNEYPVTTMEDIKKSIIITVMEEYLSFKNENNLLFLSGGVDSVLCMLLAKSISLPVKYIHMIVDKNVTAYVQFLQRRYGLDIDFVNPKDIKITKDLYNKILCYNPPLWTIGGLGDLVISQIICFDNYKEYHNVILGPHERHLNQHFWNVYQIVETSDLEQYNSKYGKYIKYFPDEQKTRHARMTNKLERQSHALKFMRSFVNFEGITNKYFSKSWMSKELTQVCHGLVDKEDLIKNSYKIPQLEICKEMDKEWNPPKAWTPATYMKSINITYTDHIYNWFINYEKTKNIYR